MGNETWSPAEIWALVAGALGAFILISNAIEKFANLRKTAKAPHDRLNERMDAFEEWKKEVDRKLNNDKEQLESIQDGLRASYQAQLALLDHGIDGNNVKQMQDAKEVLQKHLINHH